MRLSRIVSRPRGRDSGTTTNPWFWEVISTRPLWQFLHRLVDPVVAELQLLRPPARPPAPGSGGPGRCRRSGPSPGATGPSRRCRAAPPDRRGRWRGGRRRAQGRGSPRPSPSPEGRGPRSPAASRFRRMLYLTPQSRTTTRRRADGAGSRTAASSGAPRPCQRYGFRQVTSFTRSRPTSPG